MSVVGIAVDCRQRIKIRLVAEVGQVGGMVMRITWGCM